MGADLQSPQEENSCFWEGYDQHLLPLPGTLIRCRWEHSSPHLRTPPHRHLPPSNPPSAPLGQVLPLRDQTLMDGAGQHRDAVLADLVAEVLAGDADGTRAGRAQNIRIQVVPLLSRGRVTGGGSDMMVRTPASVAIKR